MREVTRSLSRPSPQRIDGFAPNPYFVILADARIYLDFVIEDLSQDAELAKD